MTSNLGDKVYLGSIPGITLHGYGTLSDLDTPDQVAFTIEGYGPNALLDVSAIRGDPGIPGDNAPLGHRQFPIFDSVDDLPTNLTDDDVDVGKYWIVRQWDEEDPPNQIGSWWYMWNGTAYEQFKMGEPGQAGPVPDATWNFNLVEDDDAILEGDDSKTVQTGDDFHPFVTTYFNKEQIRGPQGPDAAWDLWSGAVVPDVGDVPTWNGTKFAAAPPVERVTKFWTYPEAAFTSVPLAIGTRVPIGSALIPPVDWDVVVDVGGHFRLTGVEADADPFIIGIEVRLGNATSGQVVARGFGNITGYVSLEAHSSTATTPSVAITPDNGVGVIPANSSGAASTLYVNAFNDGLSGFYNFNASGAQLSVRAYPV
jgi:hypothetical protein